MIQKIFSTAFILVASSFFCVTANAQAALLVLIFGDKVASEKFHLSIDGGINYSSMPGLNQQDPTIQPYFGLGTCLKLSDKWFFTPEFKPLSRRGAKDVKAIIDYSPVVTDTKYNISLNYIDVPLLIQYRITPHLFVSTGPQISFLTAASQRASGKLASGEEITAVQDVKSTFNKQYYCLPVEMGYSLSTQRGGKGIDIKVRYNIGLSEMVSSATYGSSKGSTFQFFLSFPFINPPKETQQ